MNDLFARYHGLQRRLQEQVDRNLIGNKPMVLGSLPYVLVQTEIRTIISGFLLVAVGEITLGESVSDQLSTLLVRLSILHTASSRRRNTLMAVETQDSSMLAKVAVAVVSALVAHASGRHPDRKLSRDARLAINDKGLRSHRTFAFDSRRFNAMRHILADRPRLNH